MALAARIREVLGDKPKTRQVPDRSDSKEEIGHTPLVVEIAPDFPPVARDDGLPVVPRARAQGTDNRPEDILASWVALEALSPQTYRRPSDLANGDNRCVANFTDGELPWTLGERSRPKHQLYYQIVLGSIHVDLATDALIRTFGEDEERSRREREKAALAAILVDRNGLLLEENAVAISSFGWALPIALSGELRGLGAWTAKEPELNAALTRRLTRQDDEGRPLPLDNLTLQNAFDWLVAALDLPTGLCERPTFALRVFHYFKSKNPPEVALLNSFYLADLVRAQALVAGGNEGEALSRFIGATSVGRSENVLETHEIIEALVAPAKTPYARWPSPGSHPLVTLQQAAVNAARRELLGDGEGVVAVNGPPGTGKTTLLRDVVAACVLDRADAMARFDDPAAAFTTSGLKIAAGDRAFLHLYRLDDSLKGHEVIVASSNNKAVENVSRELPASKSVGRDFAYFKTVSDRLLSRRNEAGELIEGDDTWGLIAAVLGNAQNRAAFQQAVWWDDDCSLRLYLKAAKGDAVVREIRDDEGQVVRREVPAIVTAEMPPSPEEAKRNWRKARDQFRQLRAEIDEQFGQIEDVRRMCLEVLEVRESVNALRIAADDAHAAMLNCRREETQTGAARRAAQDVVTRALQIEREVFREQPRWWHRLLKTRRMREWEARYRPLVQAWQDATRQCRDAIAVHEDAESRLHIATERFVAAEGLFENEEAQLTALERDIDDARGELGDRIVDHEFFDRGHEQWNLAAPWLPDSLHRKREDLFAAALALHRAFIDVNAQKILHNLGALMGAMQAGAFQDTAKKAMLPDLWSTLFMVCPVVSTTFASVDRMLGDLPASSFGWVLIDEAGQATPQQAVGMLMRAKRAIVVGDPLQIPPVVALPQRLIAEVAAYFCVDPILWIAPEASVQTLADQASHLCAEFRADTGVRDVGMPLLVHRRCQEPMFGISNRIAYDGQMVHAAGKPAPGKVSATLGPSTWFDIDAPAQSKWCPAEGEVVVQLLSALAAAGVQAPDIYIITPFRIVAQELRRSIEAQPGLLSSLGVDAREWLSTRVGTIHTFQGKEAESVIAVLGAPATAHHGARRWAASTPNIFNVMVSRAKQTLYVVGSRAAWSTLGHGKDVAAALPSVRANGNSLDFGGLRNRHDRHVQN